VTRHKSRPVYIEGKGASEGRGRKGEETQGGAAKKRGMLIHGCLQTGGSPGGLWRQPERVEGSVLNKKRGRKNLYVAEEVGKKASLVGEEKGQALQV